MRSSWDLPLLRHFSSPVEYTTILANLFETFDKYFLVIMIRIYVREFPFSQRKLYWNDSCINLWDGCRSRSHPLRYVTAEGGYWCAFLQSFRASELQPQSSQLYLILVRCLSLTFRSRVFTAVLTRPVRYEISPLPPLVIYTFCLAPVPRNSDRAAVSEMPGMWRREGVTLSLTASMCQNCLL